MEDFRIHTTVIDDPYEDNETYIGAGSIDHLIPLQSVFPVEEWTKLRHFELSRFVVTQSDVISFLCIAR